MEYELIIPSWSATVPADWPLEVELDSKNHPGVFTLASGSGINIIKGTHIRGGPEELLTRMLDQGFTRIVDPIEER